MSLNEFACFVFVILPPRLNENDFVCEWVGFWILIDFQSEEDE